MFTPLSRRTSSNTKSVFRLPSLSVVFKMSSISREIDKIFYQRTKKMLRAYMRSPGGYRCASGTAGDESVNLNMLQYTS